MDNKKGKGIYIEGIGLEVKPYPAWRYHDLFEPVIVENTEEDLKAQEKGWHEIDVPVTGMDHMVNWRHDLEDMNSKQLVLFAREEFEVDLPVTATEEFLIKAIWQLTKDAPQFQGRMVLLAQTIEMDYDKEQETIRGMTEGVEIDEREEVWL